MKNKAASIIRIISIPPVMVLALVLILFALLRGRFASASDCIILVLFLGIFPLLAYPYQKISPSFKDKGRDAQRKLAFIFTLVGYTAAMLWSLLSHCNTTIRSITTTYFLSVVILTALNKLAHFKASGHASSFTAPILLLVYFADWRFAIPGIIFAIAVCWSSIYLKRHTLPQLAGGMIAAIASFAIAISLIAH